MPFSDIRLLAFRQKPERLFRFIIAAPQPQADQIPNTGSGRMDATRRTTAWPGWSSGVACCELVETQHETRVKIVDPKFPGLQGLGENFTVKEESYSLKNFSKDIHVLLVLETEGMSDSDYRRRPFPIAWARREGKAAPISMPWATVTTYRGARVGPRAGRAGRWTRTSKVTPQAWAVPPEN